ncbi:MAG TPA: hypothetical protein VFK07_02995 [Candidatus Paceibacterota bacterium]|nr:hypothetical protein [Candidatus Paceibacterota bacterium]
MLHQNYNNSRGSVIIFAVLLMGTILAISLTLAAIFLPKLQTSRDSGSNSVDAIYAADSAIEWCIYTNRDKPALSEPTMSNGASFSISPSDCTTHPMDNTVVGTYKGVSRALQVETSN